MVIDDEDTDKAKSDFSELLLWEDTLTLGKPFHQKGRYILGVQQVTNYPNENSQ